MVYLIPVRSRGIVEYCRTVDRNEERPDWKLSKHGARSDRPRPRLVQVFQRLSHSSNNLRSWQPADCRPFRPATSGSEHLYMRARWQRFRKRRRDNMPHELRNAVAPSRILNEAIQMPSDAQLRRQARNLRF